MPCQKIQNQTLALRPVGILFSLNLEKNILKVLEIDVTPFGDFQVSEKTEQCKMTHLRKGKPSRGSNDMHVSSEE